MAFFCWLIYLIIYFPSAGGGTTKIRRNGQRAKSFDWDHSGGKDRKGGGGRKIEEEVEGMYVVDSFEFVYICTVFLVSFSELVIIMNSVGSFSNNWAIAWEDNAVRR